MWPILKEDIVNRSRLWYDTSVKNDREDVKRSVFNRLNCIWEKRNIMSD